MKKLLLALTVVSTILATSCKKEADVAPQTKENIPVVLDGGPKKEYSNYD